MRVPFTTGCPLQISGSMTMRDMFEKYNGENPRAIYFKPGRKRADIRLPMHQMPLLRREVEQQIPGIDKSHSHPERLGL